MGLANLNLEERRIIGECVKAAVFGPFFPDSDFKIIMGVTRDEAIIVANQFPDVDEYDEEPEGNDDSWLVINNSMVNLLGFPHGKEAVWDRYISATPEKVRHIFYRWRNT